MQYHENGIFIFEEGDNVRIAPRLYANYPDLVGKNGVVLCQWVDNLYMVDFGDDTDRVPESDGVYFFFDHEMNYVNMVIINASFREVKVGDKDNAWAATLE